MIFKEDRYLKWCPHFSIASCPGGQRRSTSLRVGVLTRSMRIQPPQFAWVSQHIYIFTINWKILEYLVISRAQVERYKFWGQPSISLMPWCLAWPCLHYLIDLIELLTFSLAAIFTDLHCQINHPMTVLFWSNLFFKILKSLRCVPNTHPGSISCTNNV